MAYLHDEGDVWFQGWSRVRVNYIGKTSPKASTKDSENGDWLDIVQEFDRLRQEGLDAQVLDAQSELWPY